MSFREICEHARVGCARLAYQRALAASSLRYDALSEGRQALARQLAQIKSRAVQQAINLAPEHAEVGIDGDFQIGLPTISWDGGERMHLLNGQGVAASAVQKTA